MKTKIPEYILFAEMLTQRPVDSRGLGSLRTLFVSEAEAQYMVEMAASKFDKIIFILRQLPKEILLIIR